jgi:hypothetical protein
MTKVVVKTQKEPIREIVVFNLLYRTVRSFVESSQKPEYPWRLGYEFDDHYTFSKNGKWELIVYKNVEVVDKYIPLPTVGIYRIEQPQIPIIASLYPFTAKLHLDFVVLKSMELAILNPRYPYNLAFTRSAPIAFVPDFVHEHVRPFVRPIFIREIIDTLSKYVEISDQE